MKGQTHQYSSVPRFRMAIEMAGGARGFPKSKIWIPNWQFPNRIITIGTRKVITIPKDPIPKRPFFFPSQFPRNSHARAFFVSSSLELEPSNDLEQT
jgi:hypothetical protein